MKRKIIYVTLIVCLVLSLLSGCGTKKVSLDKDTMLWMDAYVALAEKESTTIDVHYFYVPENAAFMPKDIAGIAFKGVENELIIDDFKASEKEAHPDDIYHSYSINLAYHFEVQGLFQVDSIIVTLVNGGKLTYPVGDWVFDVGEEPSSALTTSEGTPSATRNNRELPCTYQIENGYILDQIQTGQYEKHDIGEGGIYQHNVSVNDLDAPVYYVKPKLILSKDGQQNTQYTVGCYCGVLDITQDEIEMSRIHFKTFQKDNE